jgi:hypothetical protein
VSAFQAFLVAQQAQGVQVTRTSPTSLSLTMAGTSGAALSWQVTDLGLTQSATAEAVVAPTMLMDGNIVER